jgi:hypothetical protein
MLTELELLRARVAELETLLMGPDIMPEITLNGVPVEISTYRPEYHKYSNYNGETFIKISEKRPGGRVVTSDSIINALLSWQRMAIHELKTD